MHISLPTLKIQHTQPRGWKKRRTNNHGLGFASSVRREKSVTLLCILCFCGIMRACTRAKLPQAASNADLPSRVGQPGFCRSTGLSSHLYDFCWLVSSLPSSQLLTGLFCPLLLTDSFSSALGPSFPRPLPVSWEISRASPLCGFRAKTDKRIFWVALSYTHRNECHPSCHTITWQPRLEKSQCINQKDKQIITKYPNEYQWTKRANLCCYIIAEGFFLYYHFSLVISYHSG